MKVWYSYGLNELGISFDGIMYHVSYHGLFATDWRYIGRF